MLFDLFYRNFMQNRKPQGMDQHVESGVLLKHSRTTKRPAMETHGVSNVADSTRQPGPRSLS